MDSAIVLPFLVLLFHLTPLQGKIVFEDGYTVSTVFDGDKSNFKVNPQSILPRSPPSDDLFILLDSVASSFYTVSLLSTSNGTVVEKLAGNGEATYMDGVLGSSSFNKPRSFAVDYKGNIYVADQRNHAIRKISKSGVTTIAGGHSQKAGRSDGPAREASFSDDFELTFISKRCSLLISDHGNRLVREISLKAEDCTTHSGSGVLGMTSPWLLGLLALSCLAGLIIGLLIRPYVIPCEGIKPHHSNKSWKHSLMSLERQVLMLCSDIRSAIVKSTMFLLFWQLVTLILSQLCLIFKRRSVESYPKHEKSVSLLDNDVLVSKSNLTIPPKAFNLNELLTFDGGLVITSDSEVVRQENVKGVVDVSFAGCRDIDSMIQANLADFGGKFSKVCPLESTEWYGFD